MASIIEFGTKHLCVTGVGAVVGASVGASLGAIARVGASVGASIGAGIGAIEMFAVYPGEKMAQYLTINTVAEIDKEGNMITKTGFKSKGHKVFYHTASTINGLVVRGAIWGGAALLGIISLPAAAVIGGGGALYFAASKLEDMILTLSPKSLRPAAALITLTLKVAVIAGVFLAIIQLGLLAPPWAIALGVSAAVGALIGTGWALMDSYSEEIKAYAKSLQTPKP